MCVRVHTGLHRIQKRLAEHILKKLQLYNYDVLVCSGAWANHIHNILEEDKLAAEDKVLLEAGDIHLELFAD